MTLSVTSYFLILGVAGLATHVVSTMNSSTGTLKEEQKKEGKLEMQKNKL